MTQHEWTLPVRIEDIPETGRRYEIEVDSAQRAVLARTAGVDALPYFAGAFDVLRYGRGLRVTGTVRARVVQTCVVTLEPLENSIEEAVDLVFEPRAADFVVDGVELPDMAPDAPEPMNGGVVDLAAVAAEFLILGVDPYPRKPGAVFVPPAETEPTAHPFAPLAALLKGGGRS